MNNRGITVPQVVKDLGLEPDPRLTWAVGDRVRDLWLEEHGYLPAKELRAKTNGGGSHCFAIYPDNWRVTIEKLVRACDFERSRQSSFDF